MLQVLLADKKALLALKRAVLVLDRNHAVIAAAAKRGNILAPLDAPEARNYVAPPTRSLVADRAPLHVVDLGVLTVRVKYPVRELVDGVDIVDVLPQQMGRVEVEA